MIKELVVFYLFVFLLSTVESHKSMKKVLSIVKEIKNEMVTVDEIVDALTPIIEGSCSCCDDKPQCHAILIVAGLPEPNANNSVQALDQDGNYWCDLPDIPTERFGATMDGNILCGGQSYPSSNDCNVYNMGTWIDYPDILIEARWHSSSWGRPYPNSYVVESHIFGGFDSPNTTVVVNDVNSLPNYNYTDGGFGQCTIQFDNYVIITGGTYLGNTFFSTTVAAYNDNGFLYYLPPLVEGRFFHGCGHYIDDVGNLVYLVTGGVNTTTTDTVTTELSINEGAWFTVPTGDLPTRRHGLEGVSLNNNLFMTGGWEWDTTGDALGEVLQWDNDLNEWFLISYFTPSIFHSVSVLPCDEVKNYCITKKNSFPKRVYVDIQKADGSI